jgi:hypothetical protein
MLNSHEKNSTASWLPMKKRKPRTFTRLSARNLYFHQRLLGHDKDAAFAVALRITPPRLSNYYAGKPIPPEIEARLRALIPGLSTDWLRYGDRNGLSIELGGRIGVIEAELEAEEEAKLSPTG